MHRWNFGHISVMKIVCLMKVLNAWYTYHYGKFYTSTWILSAGPFKIFPQKTRMLVNFSISFLFSLSYVDKKYLGAAYASERVNSFNFFHFIALNPRQVSCRHSLNSVLLKTILMACPETAQRKTIKTTSHESLEIGTFFQEQIF